MQFHIKKIVAAFVLVPLISSCGESMRWAENRDLLASAMANIESNQFAEAVGSMDALMVETQEMPNEYALQRYFAACLTAQAHLRASFVKPFLMEQRPANQSSFELGSGSSSSGIPSEIGHLASSNFHIGYARDAFARASTKPLLEDGENLLPPKLAELGVANSRAYLVLALVAIQARLQFQDRVAEILEDLPQLQTLDSCEKLLSDGQVTSSMRPWIFRGIFGYLSKFPAREPEAFKFAVRTLELAGDANGTLDDENLQPVRSWIESGSSYVFRCPDDQSVVDPNLDGCPICYQSYLIFVPELKKSE